MDAHSSITIEGIPYRVCVDIDILNETDLKPQNIHDIHDVMGAVRRFIANEGAGSVQIRAGRGSWFIIEPTPTHPPSTPSPMDIKSTCGQYTTPDKYGGHATYTHYIGRYRVGRSRAAE